MLIAIGSKIQKLFFLICTFPMYFCESLYETSETGDKSLSRCSDERKFGELKFLTFRFRDIFMLWGATRCPPKKRRHQVMKSDELKIKIKNH